MWKVRCRFDAYKLEGATRRAAASACRPRQPLSLKPFDGTSLEGLTFYGIYAEGYRAPAITETLITGFHPAPADL